MNLLSKIKYLLIVAVVMMASCVNPPNYPFIPKIELVSVSDSLVDQNGIIEVTFSFEDGDGDLGNPIIADTCRDLCTPRDNDTSCYNNSNFSIFVTDQRTGCLILAGMVIPVIPPKGSSNAISGEIITNVGPICCLPPDNTAGCIPNFTYPTDSLYCTLQIRDRSGNYSNTISFGPVIIDCTK